MRACSKVIGMDVHRRQAGQLQRMSDAYRCLSVIICTGVCFQVGLLQVVFVFRLEEAYYHLYGLLVTELQGDALFLLLLLRELYSLQRAQCRINGRDARTDIGVYTVARSRLIIACYRA